MFTEKDLRWSIFLLKKRFEHSCFPVNIFMSTYFEEHLRIAASVGALLKLYSDKFCNFRFTFFICNFVTTQF